MREHSSTHAVIHHESHMTVPSWTVTPKQLARHIELYGAEYAGTVAVRRNDDKKSDVPLVMAAPARPVVAVTPAKTVSAV
jgi:hypothetical protein